MKKTESKIVAEMNSVNDQWEAFNAMSTFNYEREHDLVRKMPVEKLEAEFVELKNWAMAARYLLIVTDNGVGEILDRVKREDEFLSEKLIGIIDKILKRDQREPFDLDELAREITEIEKDVCLQSIIDEFGNPEEAGGESA